MPESNIITGQYVRINQTAASIGTRLVARGIDAIIVVAYAIGMILLMEQAITINRYYIFVFLPAILYSFLFELFNNGQSLGKMIMHIKVVKIDGSTPTIGDYFMRWLLQIIDIDMMGVGALAILLTKNSQRLGDLAAGTMVIKLNNYRQLQVSLDEFSYLERNYMPVYPQAEDLTLNQIDVIQRTLNSDYGQERNNRIELLAEKVHSMLGISYDKTSAEKFLYTIVRDYQHYSLEIV